MFTATVSSELDAIWLLVNPNEAGSVIVLPLLHPGEAIVLKSPVNVCGVGMNAVVEVPSDRREVL